jgi:hypothetical protein
MAERAIPLTQPTRAGRPNRRVSFLEALTALAIVAALLTVGARVTSRLPDERAAAIADRPTRLIQMNGVWVDTATNPKREQFFRLLDPQTGAETGETLPFRLPEYAYPRAFSADGRTLAYEDDRPSLTPPVISIVNIVTGAVRCTLTYNQPTSVMSLNADGSRVMLYRFSTPSHPPFILLTVDVASGATLNTVTLPSSSDNWPIVTPDLRTAYVLDTHDSGTWPNVTSGDVTLDVIDTATGARQIVLLPFIHAGVSPEGRTVNGQPVIRSFSPALVVSPDSARLYLVYPDTDAIAVINRREARVERNESIRPAPSAAARLVGWLAPTRVAAKEAPESANKQAAISPDGRTLAITGTEVHPRDDGSYDVTDRGVQFVDLATFTETAHLLQQQYQGYARPLTMQWSANGQALYIGSVGASPPGGGPDTYQLRVMDTRTHRITATQTYPTDPDTHRYLPETWFALPE